MAHRQSEFSCRLHVDAVLNMVHCVHRYLNDFSKALASEVRILLQEVGKLRDERRQLQQ